MNKKILIIILMLVLMATLVAGSALAKKPYIEQDFVIWDLSKAEVVQAAVPEENEVGVFLRGFTLEAKAKSQGGNMVPEGVFRLSLDAFSPYADLPASGQKAGYWYVYGTWTITKKNANPEALKFKHNPEVVEGVLVAELPFDPTTGAGNWTGKAVLQTALAAGRWSRGEGSLTFLSDLDGSLFLDLELLPEVK